MSKGYFGEEVRLLTENEEKAKAAFGWWAGRSRG
jgi:hypothetical protein